MSMHDSAANKNKKYPANNAEYYPYINIELILLQTSDNAYLYSLIKSSKSTQSQFIAAPRETTHWLFSNRCVVELFKSSWNADMCS